MKTINENKICDTHKCNNFVELGLPSTETKCPNHRVIDKPKDDSKTLELTKRQTTALKIAQVRCSFNWNDWSLNTIKNEIRITNGKAFYEFLKASWTDAYRDDRMDEYNDLVNIKTLLFKKYRISAKFTKKFKEKRIGEIEFNIHYNPIINYGSFEYYSTDDGDIYAEGGLWFSKDGELYDYDGVYSLNNVIRKQLDEWNLDTSYLD
tara:strand:- start:468 stop:1088 length:621 start_codon:yes stop_codon:yes gene_type:complete